MEYPEILRQLLETLAPYGDGHTPITADTPLIGGLVAGSLKAMNLMLAVEDHFDISIPVNILADLKTVHDLALQVQKQMQDH